MRVLGLSAAVLLAIPAMAQEAEPVAAPVAATETPAAAPVVKAPVAAVKAAPAAPVPVKGVTPNAEREVTIGAINKRTGETRTFIGRPGQGFEFGGLKVQVRACETTPPWEQKLTGAFLLIDERLVRGPAKRVFSGWMFAESPSLHPLEHPRYDIWVKSCAMRFPDTGPDTVVAGKGDTGAAPRRSKAVKSAVTPSADSN